MRNVFDTFVFKGASGKQHFVVICVCEVMSDLNDIEIQEGEIKSVRWIDKKNLKNVNIKREEYRAVLDKFFRHEHNLGRISLDRK